MRHTHEREWMFTYPQSRIDDPERWESEAGYFIEEGLGNDAGAPSGSAASKPWYQSVVESIAPVAASVYQQRQLTKINLARSQQGLPMLRADEYARAYQPPAAQVQFGPTAGAQRLLMWGAIGVGGFLLLRALKIV